MNRWRILLLLLLCLPAGFRDDQISTRTLDALKEATVFVLVRGAGDSVKAVGSGFLMKRDRETGYIATNYHVVRGGRGVAVAFNSGTDRQSIVLAKVAGVDPDLDFAILKVEHPGLPRPVEPAAFPKLKKGKGIHILGFPFPEGQKMAGSFPRVTVTPGKVNRMLKTEYGCVPHVELAGELHPGNSGGPVIDKRGALVGISVAKVKGTKIGVAIPGPELREMLLGRVRSINVRRTKGGARRNTFQAAALLIDPMKNIRTISLLLIRADRLAKNPAPDKEGRWEKIHPAMRDVRLQVKDARAQGEVVLTHSGGGKVRYLMQMRYVRGDRKIYFSEPRSIELEFFER